MSDQFQVIIVDDPQNLVIEIETVVQPDITVVISPDPTTLIVEIDNGIPGTAGPAGIGVPAGGTTGQALTKINSTNYNTHWTTIDKAFVGLSNADNTSDLGKPISTATQTALNAKEDVANKSTNIALGTSNTLYPTQNAVKVYVDGQVTTIDTNIDAYRELQKEPTGFPNRTDSTFSFVDGTRVFTVQPVAGSYDVYVKGKKFTKTGPQSITISNVAGNHFFYFDSTGALNETLTFDASLVTDNALIADVYWNTDTSSHHYFGDERHGLIMDGGTHSYLHTVFGARYISGCALQGFSVNGTGNLAANAQFTADSGSIRDEDILHQFAAVSTIPILYRQGTLWRRKTADAFPVIYSGTAGYTGAQGRLPYNQLVSGSWQFTQVANSAFVMVHFFATNDVTSAIYGIQGIATYNSITDARINANLEISTLSGLPFAEFVPIGSVIFETATGYTNAPKARVRSTDTGADYVDFRGTQLYAPAAGSSTSHGLLSGLNNDDHLQYHNDARGDARYYTKAQTDEVALVKALIFG
jgi:hypothetical protein